MSFFGCQDAEKSTYNLIKPIDLKAMQSEESFVTYQLIDVRTPEEFSAGHIDGAINIDFYDKSFAEDIAALSKNKPVIFYCKSGGRSKKAAYHAIEEVGFKEVYDLKGGYNAWKSMVVDKKLGGIQLYAKGDRNFSSEYRIKSIPRFILIDDKGNIVEANAPRPSSSRLKDLLTSLPI